MGPLPLDRLHVVNPGDNLNVGDRNLIALRPPLYDSPATTGFLDDRSGAVFTSDCFGAPLPTADEAAARSVSDLAPGTVADLEELSPAALLSAHLPPILDGLDTAFATLRRAPTAPPVPAPTQAELKAQLAQFAPAGG